MTGANLGPVSRVLLALIVLAALVAGTALVAVPVAWLLAQAGVSM